MTSNLIPPVLIVEDSEDDFEAIERALKRDGQLDNPIVHLENGSDATNYLFRTKNFADLKEPLPAMVLLDLNLPGKHGYEVLNEIKCNDATRKIPVIVFSTSNSEFDIHECYNLGANSYVQKPIFIEDFFSVLSSLKEFWLQNSLLPKA